MTESSIHRYSQWINYPAGAEPHATQCYVEAFQHFSELEGNVIMFAPRQSGKSDFLMNKFMQSDNAMFLTMHRRMQEHVRRKFGNYREDPDRNHKVRSVSNLGFEPPFRGDVFMDELDFSHALMPQTVERLVIESRRTIYISTPSGTGAQFTRFFDHTIILPRDWVDRHRNTNHFPEGLFEI